MKRTVQFEKGGVASPQQVMYEQKFYSPEDLSMEARDVIVSGLEQQNVDLEAQLLQHEKENYELKNTLNETEEELANLRAKAKILINYEQDLESVSQEKRAIEIENGQLKLVLQESSKQEKILLNQLKLASAEKNELINEKLTKLGAATADFSLLKRELEQKEGELKKTKIESELLRGKISSLQKSQEEANCHIALLTKHNENLEGINEELQHTREIIQAKVGELEDLLHVHRKREEELRGILQNLTEENIDLSQKIKVVEKNRDQLQKQTAELLRNCKDAKQKVKQYETGVEVPNFVDRQLKDLESRNSELKEKISHDQTKMKFLKRTIHDHTQQLKQQEQAQLNLERTLEHYQINFMDNRDVEKILRDMEIKYKMDLHSRIQKLNEMYDKGEKTYND